MKKRLKLHCDMYTDKGPARTLNQDSVYAYYCEEKNLGVFCVADGMGGHTDGERASQIIIEGLSRMMDRLSRKTDIDNIEVLNAVSQCVGDANQIIFNRYGSSGLICGSTVAMMAIHGNWYAVLHVGDSRIYRRRGLECICMTKDDTWENDAYNRNRFTNKDIIAQPEYGKLVKAVGATEKLIPHIQTGELKKNDSFIICSDGLYKFCTFKDIIGHLRRIRSIKRIQESRDNLINKALDNGTKDNISCVSIVMKAR